MTRRQALAEARRRWGQKGAVEFKPDAPADFRCRVGYLYQDGAFKGRLDRRGCGETWAAAFADAAALASRLKARRVEAEAAQVAARARDRLARVAERRRY